MAVAPAGTPGLSLNLTPSSSADTGDNLLESGDFNVTFGNKATARNAKAAGGAGSSWVGEIARDLVTGLAVALAARYVWGKIK